MSRLCANRVCQPATGERWWSCQRSCNNMLAPSSNAPSAASAGTMNADVVAPKAVQVMAELGVDISAQTPKALTKEMLDAADRVFIMGCDAQQYCPVVWLEDAEDWDLEDPVGQGVEKYREVRDAVRGHMERALRAEGIEPRPVG